MSILLVDPHTTKQCAYCHQYKPLSEFRRRTGKRSKLESRRGACRECRKRREAEAAGKAVLSEAAPPGSRAMPPESSAAAPAAARSAAAVRAAEVPGRQAAPVPASGFAPVPAGTGRASLRRQAEAPARKAPAPGGALAQAPVPGAAAPSAPGEARPAGERKRKRSRRPDSAERKLYGSSADGSAKPKPRPRAAEQTASLNRQRGPRPAPDDVSALIPSKRGMILMRGHSDKGRRWHQEIDLDLAVTLVREQAAVVVNKRTIRRLYSNKDFRRYILTRDNYTCYFCGLYGDTIDHLLPRAKGGHTTPMNCVCACNLCNQAKADQYADEFMGNNP
ncbi:HNH endonuclease [Paenibacillus durus]|nr:HNH endonuclease [Paenibacillus durus]